MKSVKCNFGGVDVDGVRAEKLGEEYSLLRDAELGLDAVAKRETFFVGDAFVVEEIGVFGFFCSLIIIVIISMIMMVVLVVFIRGWD